MADTNLNSKKKVQQPSKQDKNIIADLVQRYDGMSLFDLFAQIDPEMLKRSVHQILNNGLDHNPCDPKNKQLLHAFIASNDVLFRFAPAPTGDLHAGHVVPIILNLILRQICSDSGKRAKFIVRIDDTDPDIVMNPDTAVNVVPTLENILGTDLLSAGVEIYKSSEMIGPIVDSVISSICSGETLFYPDLSSQSEIKSQRDNRTPSAYRDLETDAQLRIIDDLKNGVQSGVIRAKIDYASDNGNLRDPVMVRITVIDGVVKYFPTYDLVAPLLDLYDSRRFNRMLLALRDCNYSDRLDQYLWVQKALANSDLITSVTTKTFWPDSVVYDTTAMLTFSRVRIIGASLSKRKIAAMINESHCDSQITGWSDPRLFTVRGLMSRGVTVGALLYFYWITGTISTSNKMTNILQESLFSIIDKYLSKSKYPILNRIPTTDNSTSPTVYNVTVLSYRSDRSCKSNQSDHAGPSNQAGPSDQVDHHDQVDQDDQADLSDQIGPFTIGEFRTDLDQIIATNLTDYKLLDGVVDYKECNAVGSSAADPYQIVQERFPGTFVYGFDLTPNQIIKINNFKDDDAEVTYGGYYMIRSIDRTTKSSTNLGVPVGGSIILSSISN